MSTDTIEHPAADAAHLDHPQDPAYRLPLHLVRPSAFNPRKRFDEAGLEELADSIARNGVRQAIVVRRVPPIKAGGAEFEIVAGERRWRACGLLAKRHHFGQAPDIPAFVRELDDFAAREIALTENSHRNDLHPLEEAQAYEDLLLKPVGGGDFKPARLKGCTVEQLAERIGRKPDFVFGRLKLLQLVPAAQEAFFADTLKLRVAQAIAQLPASEQERALPQIITGWGGEPFTHKQAIKHLQDHFMLALAKTVFDIADAALDPKAGACTACPKRSSANPDLFSAAGANDMCLDGACFNAKTKAFGERKLEQAHAAGQQVLTGTAAKKVLGGFDAYYSDSYLIQGGHRNLDKPAEDLTGSKKTLRTLLGKDFGAQMLVKGTEDDVPITVAKLADVKAELKAKGLLVAPGAVAGKKGKPAQKMTATELKASRDKRVHDMLEERLPGMLWKALQADGAEGFPHESKVWMSLLSEILYSQADINFQALERAVAGEGKVDPAWRKKLDTEGLARLAIVSMLCNSVGEETWSQAKGERGDEANALALDIGFDLKVVRSDIEEEVDATIRDEIAELADVVKPTAGKAPAKKAAKATKPAATPKAPAETKPAPLTPAEALAAAFKTDPKPETPAEPVKVTTKKSRTAKGDAAPVPLKNGSFLSPAAAWPFPKDAA